MIGNDDIIYLIKKNLVSIVESDEEYYKGLKVFVTMEEQDVNEKERNAIYVVVKTQPATLTYAQVIMPITLSVVSEYNNINIAITLLGAFAERYHLEMNKEKTIKQYYTSPNVVSNYNSVFDGYRSLIYLSGTLVISENANYLTVKYKGKEVQAISCVLDGTIQLDTQATYSSENFTASVGKIGTLTLSIATYLIDNDLMNDVLAIALRDKEKAPSGFDTIFELDLIFKNGIKREKDKFKLASITTQQDINNVPMANLVFTN